MKKTFRRSVLFTIVLASLGWGVEAAPKSAVSKPATKKPVEQWEYAFIHIDAFTSTRGYEYIVELRIGRRTPVRLARPKTAKDDEFLLDIFDRLGAQGWELVTGPSYRESSRYIFKRRK